MSVFGYGTVDEYNMVQDYELCGISINLNTEKEK